MSCGCGQANHEQITQMSESSLNSEPYPLTGRTIRHSTGSILNVTSPIRDVNGSLIGYITNNQEGRIIRIFAKDVVEVL
jgi:hypothetical protein